MNKKIFAALASATMALSATGSLAVFAEDFVEETNNTVTGTITPSAETVAFTKENFGDLVDNADLKTTLGVTNIGDSVKKADFEKVTTITLTNEANIKGLNLFTNLKTFSSTSSKLTVVNLSENTNLETLEITNAENLLTVELPATSLLNKVKIAGTATNRAPLSLLDLSKNKGLTDVRINYTQIGMLDLSDNKHLEFVNLKDNFINSVDLDGDYDLQQVSLDNNYLYGLELPNSSTLYALGLANNMVQSLDVTNLPGLTSLVATNNEIRSIDLSKNKALVYLEIANNHIGALDLSANTKLEDIKVSPQMDYIAEDYDSVNLADNFDNFKAKKYTFGGGDATPDADVDGVVNEITGNFYYTYATGKGDPMEVAIVRANPMNRLYNPNSGEHFYTKDLNEKDVLVDLGWHDEGIGWVAPANVTNVPVFRLYNPNAGDHHYTTSSVERDSLVNVGWKYEGIGWYSYTGGTTYTYATGDGNTATIDSVAVLRQYNPNARAAGAHNYTVNRAENDFLVSVGWLFEGRAWDAMK
ncbi:hypothetical protein [Allobaculum sp. JKK-2023]|uniref:hypothetical protein n=1 Tax=Allobaculum sp. JKK-2023 TaxID=3108943 RepID=UPI002B05AE38|nr:hypothetical protein [Allobaculum sp. JKK-2023]